MTTSVALLALCAWGCDSEVWVRSSGTRVLHEVSPQEARRLLAAPGTLLVEAGESGLDLGRAPHATLWREDAPLPDAPTRPEAWVVVAGADGVRAMRLGARVSRAGALRVAVVRPLPDGEPARAGLREPIGG